ncbi:MAG: hypothetical protein Q8N10_01195 [Phenylobacterium sp.]|uniref:hypothetical protein n=1 Tax=Phenylobacterium sp. TaxID=1871053 RepID=UPI0027228732|nr:hypothetical protein [Phenylobacterium sp.]MDO8911393.1 hypothetical protein [Phenylobacterium sp.]MDO9249070.1 hypothetical protein [Phenylobacterium sp.]MDP2009339.1 hypothetical protein [Phenylobacterium sp.]MDP3099096.1 hypothetical protein [Phenylobacterium sp.]MDP3633789.1 hypothetical protein [Phenylobacterium sp.]
MQTEAPDTNPAEALEPTAEIITYAQFLSAKARRDLDRIAAGEPAPHGYPWAYLFEPPAN